jgi:hypothetical protein
MQNPKLNDAVEQFLNPKIVTPISDDDKDQEVCDLQTGECYVIRTKDGIVERINKTYVTEDGRQLLQD